MKISWEVLLIGGGSGTGKSYLARQLSEHFKVPLSEVDDIRISLQQIADKEKYPELFAFLNNANYQNEMDENVFTQKLIGIGKVVWKSLKVLISKHAFLKETIIFEGDGIIPGLLKEIDLEKVKIIFLYDDLESIKERQLKRNRHGKISETVEKDALFAFTFNEAIREQAEANGFTTIKASPVETLFDRVLKEMER